MPEKYKGKRKYDNKWVEGYFVKGENSYIIPEEEFYYAVVSRADQFGINHMSTSGCLIYPDSIKSSTGKSDCKGNLIYDKDDMKITLYDCSKEVKTFVRTIKYNPNRMCYMLMDEDNLIYESLDQFMDNLNGLTFSWEVLQGE